MAEQDELGALVDIERLATALVTRIEHEARIAPVHYKDGWRRCAKAIRQIRAHARRRADRLRREAKRRA